MAASSSNSMMASSSSNEITIFLTSSKYKTLPMMKVSVSQGQIVNIEEEETKALIEKKEAAAAAAQAKAEAAAAAKAAPKISAKAKAKAKAEAKARAAVQATADEALDMLDMNIAEKLDIIYKRNAVATKKFNAEVKAKAKAKQRVHAIKHYTDKPWDAQHELQRALCHEKALKRWIEVHPDEVASSKTLYAWAVTL